MLLERYSGNPVISPKADSWWQSEVTANPGAWYDAATGKVTMLFRASAADDEHKVYLGLAESANGYDFERVGDEPAVSPSHGFDMGCVEDPRIVKFGDWYFIVYASRPFPAGKYWLKTPHEQWKPPFATEDWPLAMRESMSSSGLLLTNDFRTFYRGGRITDPMIDDRDAILFPEKIDGQFALLHRPMQWTGPDYGTDFPAMWICFSDDCLKWTDKEQYLLAKAEYDWECKIGGSTPPLRTAAGWLVIYHAVGPDKHYRVGAMLLDLADPRRVTHRSPTWLMQPEEAYELEGYYQGCIFPCGNVIIDDTLFVYYGSGDRHVGVATCPLDGLLDHLRQHPV